MVETRERRSEISKNLWNTPEYREKLLEIRQSDEYRKNQSNKRKELWETPEYREKVVSAKNTDQSREKMSQSATLFWQNPEYREMLEAIARDPVRRQIKKEKSLEYWSDPENIEAQRIRSSNFWKDKDYIEKVKNSFNMRPTSYEEKIIELIKTYYLPFIYVGDGEFWIDGFNPDFVYREKNMLIEVGDSHWHPRERDVERTARFSSAGYKTLFLYEKDLLREDWEEHCLRLIENFMEG